MHLKIALFPLMLVVVATLPGPGEGQEIARIWNGVMTLSTGPRVEVYLTSFETEDGIRATIKTFDGPVSDVTNLIWEERVLAFRWGSFQCDLREDASRGYEGNCALDGGGSATLTLDLPPDLKEATDMRAAGAASGGDVLTTDELVSSGMLTLYEAIEQLKPRWLIPRGPNKYLRRLFVYVYADGQRIGDVDVLRSMRPGDVTTVRYYNASDATQRFGATNEGGAIALTRRRQPFE